MRTSFLSIAASAAALVSLCSCDNISEEERLIPIIEREHSEKVVLLEEFTGARCVNCPSAAAVIHDMLESEAFADNLVVVSLYPSQMEGNTYPITTDLRTDVATELFGAYNGMSVGLPCALIDRMPFNGTMLQANSSLWPTHVTNRLFPNGLDGEPCIPPVNIELTSDYDAQSRNLTVNYSVEVVDPLIDESFLQLYLTENGIISMQLSLTGLIQDYENNHVVRTAINGNWGSSLGAALIPGTVLTGSYSVTLEQDWKAENTEVVGFVYRGTDRQVLQAHLLKNPTQND